MSDFSFLLPKPLKRDVRRFSFKAGFVSVVAVAAAGVVPAGVVSVGDSVMALVSVAVDEVTGSSTLASFFCYPGFSQCKQSYLTNTHLKFRVLSFEETHHSTFVGGRGRALGSSRGGSHLSMHTGHRSIMCGDCSIERRSDRCCVEGLVLNRLFNLGSSLRDGRNWCDFGVFSGNTGSNIGLRLFGGWAGDIFLATEQVAKYGGTFTSLLFLGVRSLGGGELGLGFIALRLLGCNNGSRC